MTRLGSTDLEISPLCLGGNVFGWTADEAESFAVLDAFAEAGGTFIDTADGYSAWVPGHSGGESEAVLGRWTAARGKRDDLVIATKVGSMPGLTGLAAGTVRAAARSSLERLQTDRIDLYYAHRDDPATDLAETMGASDALVRDGLVRHVAASDYSAARLAEAAQPTVVAPLVSARSPEQLAEVLPAQDLRLPRDELERLAAAWS